MLQMMDLGNRSDSSKSGAFSSVPVSLGLQCWSVVYLDRQVVERQPASTLVRSRHCMRLLGMLKKCSVISSVGRSTTAVHGSVSKEPSSVTRDHASLITIYGRDTTS